MAQLTNRRLSREFMDDPGATRDELAEALHFLRLVNARLGGVKAALWHLSRWSRNWRRDEVFRILDVGTGSADIPLAIADWAKPHGHRVQITGVDLHPVTVELARQFVASRDEITIMQADAMKLMDVFAPTSFDYAHAGLFLHHLDDLQVMTVLRIMDRLTTRGFIWNDLVRGWMGRIGVRLVMLGRNVPALVRHDAIVSVEAGFTKREALELAQRAGIQRAQYRRHLLHRFTIASEKPAAG